MYAYLKNNNWQRANLSSRFNGVRDFHLLTDEERAKHNFYPCNVIGESYDILRENRTQQPIQWELKDGIVTATYQVATKPFTQVFDEQREKFKTKRDAIINADINGVQVATLENRENIKGAIESFEDLATDGAIAWIMSDNTISSLTKVELQGIANAYALRKNEAFGAYGAKCKQLEDATTIDELLAVEWIV